jgi:transposase InsO family protein
VRRIHAELQRGGVRVGYKRVQRIMREMGLVRVHPKPRKRTTIPAAMPSQLPDLVLTLIKLVRTVAPDFGEGFGEVVG